MKKYELENLLRNTPETSAEVDAQLHQDIMRSVRLARPVDDAPRFAWAGPALGAVMAVLVLAVLNFSNVSGVKTEQPLVIQKISQLKTAEAFGDSLKHLTGKTLLTESELKTEYERLKSDLKRFDFRS